MSRIFAGIRSNGILTQVTITPLSTFVGPALVPTGQAFLVPVAGRISRTGIRGQYQPSTLSISWKVLGASPDIARQNLDRLMQTLETPEVIYIGTRYLKISSLRRAEPPLEGFASLTWSGSHTYDLLSPRYFDDSGTGWPTP